MKITHVIDRRKFVCFELDRCPDGYMDSIEREDFFEIIWFRQGAQHFACLISPYRRPILSLEDKEGYLIAFKREYLEEEEKEYALDVFTL